MFHDHVKLSSACATQASPGRDHNQDRVLNLKDHRFFAVADGMGGRRGGEIASSHAIASISESIRQLFEHNQRYDLQSLTEHILKAVRTANATVFDLAQTRNLEGMGSTLCSLLFDGRFAIHAHIGDSRLYRLREGELALLTSDHSVMRERLTKKQADATAHKHILTRALGCEPTANITIAAQAAFPKDRYLLCTDGIHDVLSSDEIKKLITTPSLQDACNELIAAARQKGSLDDITTSLIQVEFPDPL